jgi:hypothetical protein
MKKFIGKLEKKIKMEILIQRKRDEYPNRRIFYDMLINYLSQQSVSAYNYDSLSKSKWKEFSTCETSQDILSCLEGGFIQEFYVCYDYAKSGHLEVLQYLTEIGYKFTSIMFYYASLNGHLDCIKYLYELKCYCACAANTCSASAQHGHLNTLIWIHENSCHWDTYTSYYATRNGHIKCLEYLI